MRTKLTFRDGWRLVMCGTGGPELPFYIASELAARVEEHGRIIHVSVTRGEENGQ